MHNENLLQWPDCYYSRCPQLCALLVSLTTLLSASSGDWRLEPSLRAGKRGLLGICDRNGQAIKTSLACSCNVHDCNLRYISAPLHLSFYIALSAVSGHKIADRLPLRSLLMYPLLCGNMM